MVPPRPTSPLARLSGGALAALLLAACGGGSSPAPAACVASTAPATACNASSPVATVVASQAWQLYGPSDWGTGCTLRVTAPALASDERVAVVLVNAGGPDHATPSISVTGTQAFTYADAPAPVASLAVGTGALLSAPAVDRTPIEVGHALASARRRASTAAWLAAGAPLPAAPSTSRLQAAVPAVAPAIGDPRANGGFCVYNFATDKTTRQPAKLRWITANALFYVTDEAWTRMTAAGGVLAQRPDMWTTLESYFEGTVNAAHNPTGALRIQPELHASFGTESDVDQNGKVIFLFADLGHTTGGFTVGYFDSNDVTQPVDTSSDCRFGGYNRADMLYLLDPATFNGLGYPLGVVLDQEVPGTMAHELQHDVIFNTRCLAHGVTPSCGIVDDPGGDLWMNEGLSMLSEDLAGFGLNGATERTRLASYLNCKRTGNRLCYQDVSLTRWPCDDPGDATGHYGGSHAFLRWHADHVGGGCLPGGTGGCAFSKALVGSSQGSRLAVAAASRLPTNPTSPTFEEGYALFAAATLFSGEAAKFTSYPAYPATPAPLFDFATTAGAVTIPWSPLHDTVSRVAYTPLPTAGSTELHDDGWGAYVSGKGLATTPASDATLTISATAAKQPRVAVIRFKGSLAPP